MSDKCSIGNISLQKVSIIRRSDIMNSVNGDYDELLELSSVHLLRGISFSQNRTIKPISYNRGAYVDTSDEMFQPEKLTMQIYTIEDIERVKRFIRMSKRGGVESDLVMKFEFNHKTMFCDVTYVADTVDTYTVLDKWSIEFLRTSMFYKVKVASGLSVEFSNDGDVDGSMTAFISGSVTNPSITIYSYESGEYQQLSLTYTNGHTNLYYSTVDGHIKLYGVDTVTEVKTELDQYRNFLEKGYVNIPVGTGLIGVSGIYGYMKVGLYEYYYNI